MMFYKWDIVLVKYFRYMVYPFFEILLWIRQCDEWMGTYANLYVLNDFVLLMLEIEVGAYVIN